ncbi:degenerin-like protein asic-1 [Glandiceps talaboti]
MKCLIKHCFSVLSHFLTFQDEKYGNCFTYNHKGEHFVKNPGAKNGFRLTLFNEQAEYTSVHGQDSGVRVVIIPPHLIPVPQQDGFTVKPGSISSIAIKETCEHACISKAMETYCGCTDSMHIDVAACKILDEDEDEGMINLDEGMINQDEGMINQDEGMINLDEDEGMVNHDEGVIKLDEGMINQDEGMINLDEARCRSLIYYFYRYNMLQCDCRQPCNEMQYSLTMSQSQWPSDVYLKHLLKTVHNKNSKTRTINNAESARSNFLRLEVYFERLSYEVITEYEAYTWEDLLSDVGGTLGLYVGLSVITVCEFLKLFIDICKYWRRNKGQNVQLNGDTAVA